MPCLLVLLILASGVRSFCQYNFSSWTADDGLPQNSVYAILQTREVWKNLRQIGQKTAAHAREVK